LSEPTLTGVGRIFSKSISTGTTALERRLEMLVVIFFVFLKLLKKCCGMYYSKYEFDEVVNLN
jgi:hypothetical protein